MKIYINDVFLKNVDINLDDYELSGFMMHPEIYESTKELDIVYIRTTVDSIYIGTTNVSV